MKTNFKRIGKQSISIVLAVMMMLSTMLVGMVTSNAAINNWVLSGSFNNWTEIPLVVLMAVLLLMTFLLIKVQQLNLEPMLMKIIN